MIWFIRKIDYFNEKWSQERTYYTAEEPTDTFNVPDKIKSGCCVPVNTGRAGEEGAYIEAESQEEALDWVRTHL